MAINGLNIALGKLDSHFQNLKENCRHDHISLYFKANEYLLSFKIERKSKDDHIPLNLIGNGNIFFWLYK